MVSFFILCVVADLCNAVVYTDASGRHDGTAYSKLELWHSDVRLAKRALSSLLNVSPGVL